MARHVSISVKMLLDFSLLTSSQFHRTILHQSGCVELGPEVWVHLGSVVPSRRALRVLLSAGSQGSLA